MIYHLVAFLLQELPGAVRRLLDPVPSHEERGAENMLYLAEVQHYADAPDLPIPLLSEEQGRALAEADAAEATAWSRHLAGDTTAGEDL